MKTYFLTTLLVLFSSLLSSSYAVAKKRDLTFKKACHPGTQVTISAVGDLLLHAPLQRQAYSSRSGFKSLWKEAIPYFRQADIAYANLEGPVADGVQCSGRQTNQRHQVVGPDCRKTRRSVYTSYPMFNYHSRLIDDLLDSGINIVSTANNHSLDRFARGASATIKALDRKGLDFFGTREGFNSQRPWYKITKVKGKTLAWISCTYGTNGFRDKKGQVLYCFSGNKVKHLISSLKNSVDAIIVTPHWGYEYRLSPNYRQKKYARAWLEAGATAIIGAHPHVVQPWEKYITKDQRETVIIYSLGNFVSGQGSFTKRASLIFFLGLTFAKGQAWVNGVRYAPAYMTRSRYGLSLAVSSIYKSSVRRSLLPFLSRAFGYKRALKAQERVITNMECRR